MNYRSVSVALIGFGAAWLMADDKVANKLASDNANKSTNQLVHASTQSEARSRALLLHELVNGTLQVVHRDFFDADNAHAIPSASLKDVFLEMEKEFSVKMNWLTVNADVVNVDHQAKTDFEKSAVTSLGAGKAYVDASTAEGYQFAGAIHLKSQCLKCHMKLRTSNEDRVSGLMITMPIDKPQKE